MRKQYEKVSFEFIIKVAFFFNHQRNDPNIWGSAVSYCREDISVKLFPLSVCVLVNYPVTPDNRRESALLVLIYGSVRGDASRSL